MANASETSPSARRNRLVREPCADPSSELPRAGGHYMVMSYLEVGRCIRVGTLGEMNFLAGYYAYAGSALGSLEGRLRRHLGPPASRPRWHIDRLLQHASPLGAVWGVAQEGRECPLAEVLALRFLRIPRFGSTDCRCPGHLFYSHGLEDLLEGALEAFRTIGRIPQNNVKSCPG